MAYFTLTYDWMTAKFNEFNTTYFNNEIPHYRFEWMNTQNMLGQCCNGENKIRITRFFDSIITEHDCEEILIHEMVHAYIWIKNWRGDRSFREPSANHSHGIIFHREADRINRQSNHYFHIARCTKLEHRDEMPTRTKKGRGGEVAYFLVCRNNSDTKVRVGRVSFSSIQSIKDFLKKEYFDSVEVMKSTDMVRFNQFVVSRKNFNYHTYTATEYNECFEPYALPA